MIFGIICNDNNTGIKKFKKIIKNQERVGLETFEWNRYWPGLIVYIFKHTSIYSCVGIPTEKRETVENKMQLFKLQYNSWCGMQIAEPPTEHIK